MAELKRLAGRKAELEGELHTIERQIHELEQNYLEQTNDTGNVVKGWDGYLDLLAAKPAASPAAAAPGVEPSSRVFSNSSSTAPLQESVDKAMGLGAAEESGGGSGAGTGAGAAGSR